MPQSHRGTEVIMDSDIDNLNKITEKIIGCAIEVHRNLVSELLESIYGSALCYKLNGNDITYRKQVGILSSNPEKWNI